MGLKAGGARGSVRNVSVGVDAIPDSVVDRYLAANFADPWPNEVDGRNSMTISGLTASTFSNGEASVAGDGSSHGRADTFNFGASETFGLAFTIQTTDNNYVLGRFDSNFNNEEIIQITNSKARLGVQAANNIIRVDSVSDVADGSIHLCVVNKNGDDGTQINWYIDDMADGAAEQSIDTNASGYNSGDFTAPSHNKVFYGFGAGSGATSRITADIGIFDFKSTPYTESERQNLKANRPEV